MFRVSIRLVPIVAALLALPALASAQVLEIGGGRGGEVRIGDRERERARLACREEARRQDFSVRGVTPARELDGRRLRMRMDLERGDRRWLGTCTYDIRARRAELEASRVESGRPDRPGRPARPAAAASARNARDACVREVTQNARTQLVAVGRPERRSGGTTVVPMTINVEGTERRVRCFYDNATGAVTIR
jgi:hypothetical protein